MSVDGGLFLGGNRPVGFEPAEVIEPNHVMERERTTHASDPPVEAAVAQRVPAVQRISPALTGGREVVGRHAGDADHAAVLVQLEDLRVSPDIGAVVADKDGDVAEDTDVAHVCVLAKRAPLLVEQVLNRLL